MSISISFVIWFSISAFLLIFWFWTSYVLYKQRGAWKAYAEKKKLRYYSNSFYEGPSISGAIDEYKITIFTSEHSEIDARSQRRLSAIEVNLHSGFPVHAAVASGGMVSLVENLNMKHEFKPKIKGWDDSYVIRSDSMGYMREYLNDDRLKKILELMDVDKVWVVLLFLDDTALLRVDTPAAMDHPKKIDKLVKQMINVARVLELKGDENKELLRKCSTSNEDKSKLDIDDDIMSDDLGLELED